MARVIVIGAGLAGLATAMEASVRGHHVVVPVSYTHLTLPTILLV